jgi:hypothetical protein
MIACGAGGSAMLTFVRALVGFVCAASAIIPTKFLCVLLTVSQPPPGQAQLDLAGTYDSTLTAAAPKPVYSLMLAAGGTATWSTLYLGKDNATQPAHWRLTGSELVVSFDALGPASPPSPITFHYHPHRSELRPVHWNQSEWGRAGPPVLHRKRHRSQETNS